MKEVNRISFLGIPVDVIADDAVIPKIEEMIRDGKKHRITLLTLSRILRAKRSKKYREIVESSSLILPVSRAIIRGAKFQKKESLTRINPYEFIIKALSVAERLDKGVYILGAAKKEILEAEKNLRASFPKMKIVGRFSGYFTKDQEEAIKISIRKASPALTLVGKGVPKKERWLQIHMKDFNPGIFLWVDNTLDIFAGKDKNTSKRMFRLGLESMTGFMTHPWRIFRIFPYLYFKFLVLLYKLMNK